MNTRGHTQIIILDLDGVVLEKSRFASLLQERFGISPQTTAPFFKNAFVRCQLGKADLKDELSGSLAKWGWPHSVEDFLDFWFASDSSPQRGMKTILETLRKQGVACYLATNQEKHRTAFLRRHLAIESQFDAVFYSADLGVRKPADAFYEAIESHVRVPTAEIYFWDDTEENVLSARRRGWTAQLFTDMEAFREQLRPFLSRSTCGTTGL